MATRKDIERMCHHYNLMCGTADPRAIGHIHVEYGNRRNGISNSVIYNHLSGPDTPVTPHGCYETVLFKGATRREVYAYLRGYLDAAAHARGPIDFHYIGRS